MRDNGQIAVFGDSILKEVVLDTDNGRYYIPKDNITKNMSETFSLNIQNNSRFGCTISKGFDQMQRALAKGLTCDVVVLGFGGNDCDHNWAQVAKDPKASHKAATPIDVFEKIYREMIQKLKENNIIPIIISLPPIDGEKYFDWITRTDLDKNNIMEFIGDKQALSRLQELYSNTAVKIAHDTNTFLVDVRSKFLDKTNFKDLICADGIHPTPLGHKLIMQAFYEFAKTHLYE